MIRRIVSLLLVVVLLSLRSVPVFAVLSPDQKKLYDGGTNFYDIEECGIEESGATTSADISGIQVPPGLQQFGEGSTNLKKLFFWVETKTGVPGALLAAQSYQESSTYWDKEKYNDQAIIQYSYMIQGAGKQEVPDSNLNTAAGSSSGPMQLDMPGGGNYNPKRMEAFKQAFGVDFPESPRGNLMFDTAIGFAAIIAKEKAGGQDPRVFYASESNTLSYLNMYGTTGAGGKVWAHYQEWGGANGGAQNVAPGAPAPTTPPAPTAQGGGAPAGPAPASGSFDSSGVTEQGKQLFSQVEGTIKELQPHYEAAGQAENIPWQFLAALHYRESTTNPGASIGSGEPLGSVNPDSGDVWPTDLTENYKRGAQHIKEMAKMVYGIELTASSSFEEMRDAFVAYNRGFMYKRVNQDPDTSPYAMNFFDAEHAGDGGDGMLFPNNSSEPGSTQGLRDQRPGAMTIMALLGGVSGGSDSCGQVAVAGDFVFPLTTTKADMSSQNGGQFSGGKMNEGGHPYAAHDIMANPDTPVVASLGGTVSHIGEDKCPGRLVSVYSEANDVVISYLHMNMNTMVSEGQVVQAGEQIGVVGPPGAGCGSAHLHIDAAIGNDRPGCKREDCPSENAAKFRQGSDKIQLAVKLFETYEKLP